MTAPEPAAIPAEPDDCFACRTEADAGGLPLRERISSDKHWRVAHALGTALPGWLVLVPRRHVVTLADLTDAEAASLGRWQVELSRALREVIGCERTYIAQFAEKEGFSHVHFHVVPRSAGLPPSHRGPSVFRYLACPPEEHVSIKDVDALALSLRSWFVREGRVNQGGVEGE